MRKLPLFASTEILHIRTQVFRNWNMSLWIAQPFITYEGFRPTFGREEIESRITRFRSVLPTQIGTASTGKYSDAIGTFLLHETEVFNDILVFLKRALRRMRKNWTSDEAGVFCKGDIPRNWRVMMHLWCVRDIAALESHLTDRHAQIHRWLAHTTDYCDLRFIDDPRFLLECARVQGALNVGEEVDYRFRIEEEMPTAKENEIALGGATMVCGDLTVVDDVLAVCLGDPKKGPRKKVPWIVAEIVPVSRKIESSVPHLQIPLFRQMLISSMDYDLKEARIVEGASTNLVWMVDVPSLLTSNDLLLEGTCLYCQMTDQI
jgi:hypothetical protein